MVPPEDWTDLSLRLILHGRQVCLARRPRCEVCVLETWCPSSSLRPGPRAGKAVSGRGTGADGARGGRPSPRPRPR
jgi:hypothetical protein